MMPAMRTRRKEAGAGKGRAPRLLVEERRRRILELVDKQERVTVEELVARFCGLGGHRSAATSMRSRTWARSCAPTAGRYGGATRRKTCRSP